MSESQTSSPDRPPAPPRLIVQRRFLAAAIAVAASLVVYAAAGFLAVPWLAERELARFAARSADHAAGAERIRFNPFGWTLELEAVAVRDPETGFALSAPRLELDLAAVSVIQRRLVVSALALEGPEVVITATGDGERPTDLIESWRIDRLAVRNGALRIVEPGPAPAGGAEGADVQRQWVFEDVAATATGFDGRENLPVSFAFTARAAEGTSLEVDGEVEPGTGRARGRLSLSGLDLAALRRRIEPRLAGAEPRGHADLEGDFSFDSADEAAWLVLTDARARLQALAFEPSAGIVVSTPAVALGLQLTVARTQQGYAPRGRIEVVDGGFELADTRRAARVEFTFGEVAGAVSLLEGGAPGVPDLEIRLDGRLSGGGAAALAAQRHASERGEEWRSVDLRLTDVPAAQLAPYAARAVEADLVAGRVDLELEYAQSADALAGSLRIATAGLDLAARAQDAPRVELAAALLEDAQGAMSFTVPLAARVTARGLPPVLGQALAAHVRSVAAAPFDVLGRLVGRDAATLRFVPFEPGSAELPEAARATVEALASALRARPRLGLRVDGGFVRRVDRDALAAQQIELHVLLATAGPQLNARPEPVDFASARAQDVLDEFARERLAAGRLQALAARFPFAPDAPAAAPARVDYYSAVFEALAANETIGEAPLRRLGRFRAQSVAGALGALGVDPERIDVGDGTFRAASDDSGIEIPVDVFAARESGGAAAAEVGAVPR